MPICRNIFLYLACLVMIALAWPCHAQQAVTDIVSDGSWKANSTEYPGWELPGYDDSQWGLAACPAPNGVTPIVPGSQTMWVGVASQFAKTFYRKNYIIEGTVDSAQLTATADNEFGLYVNGTFVGKGTDWAKFYTFDIKPYLKRGSNTIAFLGKEYQLGTPSQLSFYGKIYSNNKIRVHKDTAICEGDSLLAGGKYQKLGGAFYDSFTSVKGYDSIVTTQLKINTVPHIFYDTTICAGDSMWTGNAWISTPGNFTSRLTASTGCDSFTHVQLYLAARQDTSISLSICQGDSVFTGNSWKSRSGHYVEKYIRNGRCSLVTTNMQVLETPVATFTISPNKEYAPCRLQILNTGSKAGNYHWELKSDSITQYYEGREPKISISEAGSYRLRLTAYNSNGCQDTASMGPLDMYHLPQAYIPNAFTPNGDNMNNSWEISSLHTIKLEGWLYNRWGQEIYAWQMPEGKWWDGEVKGRPAQEGVYVYKLRLTDGMGRHHYYYGHVSLLR